MTMKRWCLLLILPLASLASAKERSRDLGVPFEGKTGVWNAITDVRGVEVGYRTLVAGEGAKAVRTGVTAVFPRGKNSDIPIGSARCSANMGGDVGGWNNRTQRRKSMAIVVKFSVSNCSAEKYDEVLRRLEAAGSLAPAGQLFHVSYGARDNIQVIDVFDSQQSMEKFGKVLLPILAEMGVQAQPEVHEAYKIQGPTDPRPHAP